MLFKLSSRAVAFCMVFVFSVWMLGVSGTPSSSSTFPMMQIAAASEKGEEVKEESMEKSKGKKSKKAEKKKMKKKNKDKMTKKEKATKPPEE